MFGKWKLEHPAFICLLLVLCVAAVYAPAIFLEFTNYDDPYYVTENSHVRNGLSWSALRWIWTHTSVGNWHPITLMSHALDCDIYGLKPAGHHLTNVLFHTANGVILFLLLRSLTSATWRSAAVAALFVLHPLRVESVAWISERKDVLSTFFGLLSLWAYAGYAKSVECRETREGERDLSARRRRRSLYYIVALALFALGLMSKPMLVTWPCVMLLLDYWPLDRMRFGRKVSGTGLSQEGFSFSQWRRLLVEKIPFFVLSAIACVIAILAQREGGAMAPVEEIPLGARVLNAVISYGRYIGKSIWPGGLAPIYPYRQEWSRWEIFAALVVLGGVTSVAIWKRKERPYLLIGWAWFLGTLVPVSGLVQVGNQSMADRYTYIPAIGLLTIIVWAVWDFTKQVFWQQAGAATAAIVAIVASGLVTQKQLMYWQNTETLFRHTLNVTDRNCIAWNSLGFHFANFHEFRQAESCFRAALTNCPNNYYSLSGLASALNGQGSYEDAVVCALRTLQLNPRMGAAYRTLASALTKQGKMNEAILAYEEMLRLEPDNAEAHYNFANALARQEQFEKARQHYEVAVQLEPRSADAHNNLAYMLIREGKVKQATEEFRTVLELRPDSWRARYGLGDALARQGRLKEAAGELLEVLKAQPNFGGALIQLNRIAWILASHPESQVRDGKKAVEFAERLCDLTGHTNAAMLQTLAVAQAETGKFAEAIGSSEQARTLALAAGQADIARKAEELAGLFRVGKPYREVPASGQR